MTRGTGPAYAELAVATPYSFLRGASHAHELVERARDLALSALAVTDRNTLAGVVRAHVAAKTCGLKLVIGARLAFEDAAPDLLAYAPDRTAYGRLSRLITRGAMRDDALKGECRLVFDDLADELGPEGGGLLFALMAPPRPDDGLVPWLDRVANLAPGRCWLATTQDHGPMDARRLDRLADLAARTGVPLLAVNDVVVHDAARRPLQDVMTCIREHVTLAEAGPRLLANAERRLKSPAEMARLFRDHPAALAETLRLADLCHFSLDELTYTYPNEPVPAGVSPQAHLEVLTWEGARWRYPHGIPEKVSSILRDEFELIAQKDYARYFLTVHDVVRFARSRGILCQGRGSAANSAVCYCLGVTAVDPTEHDLLFARFISAERDEPPDIDVDFEHERREEVIQYIYQRYGRHRAAICATVIHYRPRSAIREAGKVFGLSEDVTGALAGMVWGAWGEAPPDAHIRQAGLDPANPVIAQAVSMAGELLGFPRHLSQHVGGFVLTEGRLDETVPVVNAAMPDRTFIEWDKDDIDALGLMKVDVLALGMLSALRKSFAMLPPLPDGTVITDIAHVPQEVPQVFDMLCKADSVGVFQVESRAQMSMLPRLKPRTFYDLVIEVAIVRPGPIQGNMVHPYLRRRNDPQAIVFPKPNPPHPPDELEKILKKTMGVPLFQEQAMRIAIEGAGFSENDADGLRRAMATFRHHGNVGEYEQQFITGMRAKGYDEQFIQDCFHQIEGFGSYGFPESHAISFALLVYASAWVKWRWPDAFCAALINSQPMGFYQPSQLVRDAREHGVEVRPPDVMTSDWDCTLEPQEGKRLRAVRLGLRQIKGLQRDEGLRLVELRAQGVASPEGFARGLTRRTLELLAEADAFAGLGYSRRQALWAVKGLAGEAQVETRAPLMARQTLKEVQVELPLMSAPLEVAEDYRTTRLSLKAHPCSFFRPELERLGAVPAGRLKTLRHGRRTCVGGLVLVRQRPGTAKGVVFMTLEDETGTANVVIWKDVFDANRRLIMGGSLIAVQGQLQIEDAIIHVVAKSFIDLSHLAVAMRQEDPDARLETRARGRLLASRDFH